MQVVGEVWHLYFFRILSYFVRMSKCCLTSAASCLHSVKWLKKLLCWLHDCNERNFSLTPCLFYILTTPIIDIVSVATAAAVAIYTQWPLDEVKCYFACQVKQFYQPVRWQLIEILKMWTWWRWLASSRLLHWMWWPWLLVSHCTTYHMWLCLSPNAASSGFTPGTLVCAGLDYDDNDDEDKIDMHIIFIITTS